MNMEEEVGIYEVIPERLENLAKQSIASWVASRVHVLSEMLKQNYDVDTEASFRLLAQHLEHIRQYLALGVIWPAFNDVAKEIICVLTELIDDCQVDDYQPLTLNEPLQVSCLNLPIFTCYSAARMVEVVFCEKLTCLEISDKFFYWSARFPPRDTFVHKTHLLTELTEVKFTHRCCEEDLLQFLGKLRLRSVSLTGSKCNTDTMACIAQNEFIEELNLRYCYVNDSKLGWIIQLRHLRNIHLNENVTKEGYKTLLMSCKHLEYVEGVELADVLELIETDPEYKGQVFGIKRYRSTMGPTLEKLQRVVKMCPRLCDVQIFSNKNFEDNLQALTALTSLQKLTLRHYDFYNDRVCDVLYKVGPNITELNIYQNTDLDKYALLLINRVCPKLKTLKVSVSNFTGDRREIPKLLLSNILKFGRPFTALKKLHISFSQSQPQDTTRFLDIWSVVLSNCVNIECIEINTQCNLINNNVLDYFDKNPLSFLEILKIDLMMPRPVVDQFIRKCERLQTFKCNGIIE